MILEVNHCELRGQNIEPTRKINVKSAEEAKAYIHELPYSSGYEYYYGILVEGEKKSLIDPTGNQMYNLQQRFLRTILSVRD